MNRSAFDILELNSNCTIDEIKAQYRKLSKKYHPDRGGDEIYFKEITDAYNQLLQLLESGKTADDGGLGGVSSGVSSNVRNVFFANNVAHIFEQGYTKLPKNVSIKCILKYTLQVFTSETYYGSTKRINLNGANFDIKIAPGAYGGQELHMGTFDILLQETNDTPFVRNKQDLYYYVNVTLKDALLGSTLKIIHPSGEKITQPYKMDKPIMEKRVSCKGMPIYGTHAYGDLIIRFNLLFPKKIPPHIEVDLEGILDALEQYY